MNRDEGKLVSVFLDPDLYEALKARAERNDRRMAEELRHLIRHLAEQEQQ